MLNYQRVPLFSMWNHDCVTQLLNGRFGFQWISRILHLPHEYGHQAEYEEGSLTTPRFAIGDLKFFPIVIGNSPSCRVILWYYRSVCGYGSIPINTIFRGMNIHLPAILMWTKGVQGFDTLPFRSFKIHPVVLDRTSGYQNLSHTFLDKGVHLDK